MIANQLHHPVGVEVLEVATGGGNGQPALASNGVCCMTARMIRQVADDRSSTGVNPLEVWVPRTSSTSSDQAIFMNESADPIGPFNPRAIDILEYCRSDAFRLRR